MLLPAAGAIIVAILVLRPHPARPPRPSTSAHLELVRKDSLFQTLPREKGEPTGSVDVHLTPAGLSLVVHASGLVPNRRYVLDVTADSTTYSLASRPASATGEYVLDTTLTQLADGACVGDNFHPPRALRGVFTIRISLKSDGSPSSGTMPGRTPASQAGASLPCAGNGDGDFRAVLFEEKPARLRGRA